MIELYEVWRLRKVARKHFSTEPACKCKDCKTFWFSATRRHAVIADRYTGRLLWAGPREKIIISRCGDYVWPDGFAKDGASFCARDVEII